MPVWVPGQGGAMGFHHRSNARAIAAGLTYGLLATTTADTLAWGNAQTAERRSKPKAGLKPERESEVLKLLEG